MRAVIALVILAFPLLSLPREGDGTPLTSDDARHVDLFADVSAEDDAIRSGQHGPDSTATVASFGGEGPRIPSPVASEDEIRGAARATSAFPARPRRAILRC